MTTLSSQDLSAGSIREVPLRCSSLKLARFSAIIAPSFAGVRLFGSGSNSNLAHYQNAVRANPKLTDGAILELINFHLLLTLRRTDSSRIVSSTFNVSGWQAHQCYLSLIAELEEPEFTARGP